MYETDHGSATILLVKGIANPISMILSVAMMLRDSFEKQQVTEMIGKKLPPNLESRNLGHFGLVMCLPQRCDCSHYWESSKMTWERSMFSCYCYLE